MTRKVDRSPGHRRGERDPLLLPAKPEVRPEWPDVVETGLEGQRRSVEVRAWVWRTEVVLPPDYYLG